MYIEDPRVTFTRNVNKIYDSYRKVYGVSKNEVHRRMKKFGLPTMTFDFYIRGLRYPEATQLRQLAEFFQIPVEYFFKL